MSRLLAARIKLANARHRIRQAQIGDRIYDATHAPDLTADQREHIDDLKEWNAQQRNGTMDPETARTKARLDARHRPKLPADYRPRCDACGRYSSELAAYPTRPHQPADPPGELLLCDRHATIYAAGYTHLECYESTVDRQGLIIPCDRLAHVVRTDPDDPTAPPYPVCKAHDRTMEQQP